MTIEAAFLGTIGIDAESKISKANKPYLRFSVRTGDNDAAVWISVLCFDEQSIGQRDQFTKGVRVYCEGKLSPSTWTAADGAERHGLTCLAWHARLAEIGRQRQARAPRRQSVGQPREQRGLAPTSPLDTSAPFDDAIGF